MKIGGLFLIALLHMATLPCFAQSDARVKLSDEQLEQQLVLRALDRGPVFTLLGDIKPMSSDIWQMRLDSPDLDLAEVDRVRRLLKVFNDERTYSDVITITHTLKSTENRTLQAVVFDRIALARTLKRHGSFFGAYGITESSHPLHVAVTVEHMPPLERERGYGYLFGYPDHAVDFFVEAQGKWNEKQEFVQREFIRIETYGSNGTVWAVAKGETAHADSSLFVRKAEQINSTYRKLREQCGDDHTKLLAKVRQWKASKITKVE